MIVIRNRLIALFARIAIFAVLLSALIWYWPLIGYEYTPICLFEIQVGIAYLFLMFLIVVFNAIDLRHGISGVAAGAYMPVALAMTAYAVLGGTLGLSYMLPVHGLSNAQAVLYNALLIALPLLEWILFEQKGTVKAYFGITWMVYPFFYMVFTVFRAVIWRDNPLFADGSMYAYEFFDHHDPLFVLWVVLSLIVDYLFGLLLIFLNNVLGRKFKKQRGVLLD